VRISISNKTITWTEFQEMYLFEIDLVKQITEEYQEAEKEAYDKIATK